MATPKPNSNFTRVPSNLQATGIPTKLSPSTEEITIPHFQWDGSKDANNYLPLTLWSAVINPALVVGVLLYEDDILTVITQTPLFFYNGVKYTLSGGRIQSLELVIQV